MAKLGRAEVCVTININNLNYDSYRRICHKIDEVVRYEMVKEEVYKLCNLEAEVTVEGHEHYSEE